MCSGHEKCAHMCTLGTTTGGQTSLVWAFKLKTLWSTSRSCGDNAWQKGPFGRKVWPLKNDSCTKYNIWVLHVFMCIYIYICVLSVYYICIVRYMCHICVTYISAMKFPKHGLCVCPSPFDDPNMLSTCLLAFEQQSFNIIYSNSMSSNDIVVFNII